ncbi:Ras GEF [Balamuthia mandrillaris]
MANSFRVDSCQALSICNSFVNTNAAAKKTLFYEVAVKTSENIWTVSKSEDDFEALHNYYKQFKDVPELPPRSNLHPLLAFDPIFVERRRQQLEDYLRTLLLFSHTREGSDTDRFRLFINPAYAEGAMLLLKSPLPVSVESPLYIQTEKSFILGATLRWCWKRKHAVLKNGFLCIQEKQESTTCRRAIPLFISLAATVSHDDIPDIRSLRANRHHPTLYPFMLKTGHDLDMVYFLAAETETQRTEWIFSITMLAHSFAQYNPFLQRDAPTPTASSDSIQVVHSDGGAGSKGKQKEIETETDTGTCSDSKTSRSKAMLHLRNMSEFKLEYNKRTTTDTPSPEADAKEGEAGTAVSGLKAQERRARKGSIRFQEDSNDEIAYSTDKEPNTVLTQQQGTSLSSTRLVGVGFVDANTEVIYEQPEAIPAPEREGWLNKQGQAFKTWKERWFKLCADGSLYYYKSKKDDIPLGKISLEGATIRDCDEEDKFYPDRLAKEGHYGWIIETYQTPPRDWFLYVKDPEEKEAWMSDIKAAIEKIAIKERRELLSRNSTPPGLVQLPYRTPHQVAFPSIDYQVNKQIKAASIEFLFSHLFSSECDNVFFKTFLLTYRSFLEPHEFFKILKLSYENRKPVVVDNNESSPAAIYRRSSLPRKTPKDEVAKKGVRTLPSNVQQRICLILRDWIAVSFCDFNIKLKSHLMAFVEDTLSRNHALAKETEDLKAIIRFQMGKEEAFKAPIWTIAEVVPMQIDKISSQVIADQLTLIEFFKFEAIHPYEFLNQAWSKPKIKHKAKHILNVIEHFNQVATWVAEMVLSNKKVNERVKVIAKVLEIAECCRKMNNFSTTSALITGFENNAVYRLKHTWKAFSVQEPKAEKVLADLRELFSVKRSSKSYRDALRVAEPPVCPYIGTFLRDLTFLEDGNPDTLVYCVKDTEPAETKVLINFGKRRRIYEVISQLLYHRYTPYSIEPDPPLAAFLHDSISQVVLDDLKLYDISLELEPRETLSSSSSSRQL